MRGGPTVPQYNFDMLVAGAVAHVTSDWGGAFTFYVAALPSDTSWDNGSANKYF